MVHPFALKNKSGGNSGAWNEVKSGDHIIHLIDGCIGTLDECLHDGDAFVSWDDGTFGTVKWRNLAPRSKVKIYGNAWEASLG